jgi:hypothetical protein
MSQNYRAAYSPDTEGAGTEKTDSISIYPTTPTESSSIDMSKVDPTTKNSLELMKDRMNTIYKNKKIQPNLFHISVINLALTLCVLVLQAITGWMLTSFFLTVVFPLQTFLLFVFRGWIVYKYYTNNGFKKLGESLYIIPLTTISILIGWSFVGLGFIGRSHDTALFNSLDLPASMTSVQSIEHDHYAAAWPYLIAIVAITTACTIIDMVQQISIVRYAIAFEHMLRAGVYNKKQMEIDDNSDSEDEKEETKPLVEQKSEKKGRFLCCTYKRKDKARK